MSNIINIMVDDLSSSEKKSDEKHIRGNLRDILERSVKNTSQFQIDQINENILVAFDNVVSIISNIQDNKSNKDIDINTVSFTLSIDSSGKASLFSLVQSDVKIQTGITFNLKVKNND